MHNISLLLRLCDATLQRFEIIKPKIIKIIPNLLVSEIPNDL